jgi:hypothetical protein
MTGLSSDSGSTAAWVRLIDCLADAAAAGRPAPCLVDPAPFTSESHDDRREAATACTGCPGRRACARFALANSERHWVWAGVDLTPYGKSGGDAAARRRQLEVAAR